MKKNELKETDYLTYYNQYVALAGDLSLAETLAEGLLHVTEVFEELPASLHDYSYAEGKWTPKEILLHLIDTERVFAYRALTFARSENAELPGYDQDIFNDHGNANNRTMDSLIKEYVATRAATVLFFNSLEEETLKRKGIASGGPLSVGAAGFIICGHELHHCKVLKEKYISA